MEPSAITTWATVLTATGPWGIVAVLGWCVWRQQATLLDITAKATAAIERSGAALVELREAIERWRDEDHRRR